MSSVTEPIAAGSWKEFFEPGDFFRLLGTTGPVTVEFYYLGSKTVDLKDIEAGYAEYFRAQGQLPFDRVRIYSATTQTVQFVTRSGSDVRYDRGASSVTGTIALDAATLAALEQISVRPEITNGYFRGSASLPANTPDVLMLPGANVNGAILLAAGFQNVGTAGLSNGVFIAKASPPTSITDGEILLLADTSNAASYLENSSLKIPQYIAPGLGLYFIVLNACTISTRYARWKTL